MIAASDKKTSAAEAGDLRTLLEARLHPPLSDEEYRFLELQGLIAEAEAAGNVRRLHGEVLRKASKMVADLRRARGEEVEENPTKAGRMVADDQGRRYALSRLLALEAGRSSYVQDFRAAHLGGRPIEWKSIEEWIESRAAADGQASQWVEVVLPVGATLRVTVSETFIESSLPVSELAVEGTVKAKLLRYGVPGVRYVRSIAVTYGGVLDELRHLSEKLVREYRWSEDQATVFVLTGVTPYVAGITRETEVQTEHPTASRIRLEIDPIVAPVEVMRIYSTLRQEVLEGTYRPLKPKYLELAVFAAERRPPDKWAEVMKAWNAAHPDDTYQVETIFARDCTQAQRRLLRPRLNEDALL